uniref:Uncharacterized protein n=1 Tax=Anguilla anguilla TaxID=7936 RepID=A0A0E9USC0_ANGAN
MAGQLASVSPLTEVIEMYFFNLVAHCL